MQSLFSLDVTGENFSEAEVSEQSDYNYNEDEESTINVKDSSESRVNVVDEEPKLIKISLASHIRDLNNVNYTGNQEQYEVYRNLTMDIRKFIYNSIVSEDFCVNCRVVKDSEFNLAETSTPDQRSHTVDKINQEGVGTDENQNTQGSQYKEDNQHQNQYREENEKQNLHLDVNENVKANEKHYLNYDENDYGDRLVGNDEENEKQEENIGAGTMSDFLPSSSLVSHRTSMSVDGFDLMSFDMNDGIEKLTNSSLDGISSVSSLESLSMDHSEAGDNVNDNDIELASSSRDSECILLELSPSKLQRTVMEMAHVLMRRFSASYPRSFKAATGNIAADVYALGRRYYISNDHSTDDVVLANYDRSHIAFLAQLYRRHKNICYFCGFVRCDRSQSSKNSCQFQKCTTCLGYHRWSAKTCKSPNNLLDKYLQSNDWRSRRPNYWASQPNSIKELLRCFYCNNDGEANFKCQGVSCPEGAETLWIRCPELMGSKGLKHERLTKPHLFPHFEDRNFVFDKKFKVTFKR